MTQRLVEKAYAPVTIDAAKTTESINCPEATTIAYSVVVSSASTPVGTTIQIQGSLNDVNFHALDTAVTISGGTISATVHLSGTDCAFKYYRLSYGWTSGSYIATTHVLLKGEEV